MTSLPQPERIKQIICERILPGVRQPGQYVGGEVNAIRKNHADVDVTFCFAFPDTYAIGMSHTGLQILYSTMNRRPDVACERAFAPWPDMEAALRREGMPLYSLETFTPLREFDIVGFSLQYEMGYTNVLTMLDLAGIPLRSADRAANDPLVIAGGPCAFSPEPMAEFIDLFVLGDAEETIHALIDAFRAVRCGDPNSNMRRDVLVELAARVQGVYAPSLYEVAYHADGTIAVIRPKLDTVPSVVRAAAVTDLDAASFPEKPIVPLVEVVQDRITLEIMRGCTRGCRFCQAGMIKRPVRTRSQETLLRLAEKSYDATGHSEITLASLSSSDYPGIETLAREMSARFKDRAVGLSLPSLRVTDHLSALPSLISAVRKSGLTMAPEAATERLRRVINKDISDDDLCRGAEAAFRQGWQQVKLYFMIGLPTETDEDVLRIVDLAQRISSLRRRTTKRPARVNVSIAPFVPKAHTPFQWEPMAPIERLEEIRRLLLDRLRSHSVRLKFHRFERSHLEGVFARGDRRLSAVIEAAWRDGRRFDSWDEHFDFDHWMNAIEQAGLSAAFYAQRERAAEEVMPWAHVSCGVSDAFLRRERERAFRGELTPDCRDAGCTGCGAFACRTETKASA